MEVSELGVGSKAEEVFKGEGVETLFPPQEQAVKAGVMEGQSLVISTPTASGKTVIAELAALSAMRQGGQVVYIVPLRALASEKFADFQKWGKLGFRVDLQMGDLDSKFLPQRNTADIVIATAEKCDSILRSKPGWFRDVKLLVIDEIHLITTNRGPTYEVLIAKFKKTFPNIQLLGLSATIGNADELGAWLDAEVIKSDWRPVKLTQRIKQGKAKVMLSEARKTLGEGAQSLVFVNSRRSAEAVADRFSEKFEKLLDEETSKSLEQASEEILNALSTPTAQCKRLANAVRGGAAFHHAGLVNKQRALVEQAFKQGLIKVISATPTLCLDADTKVWSGMKEVSVKNLKTNNQVLTLEGANLKPLTPESLSDMEAPESLVEISSCCYGPVKVTRNHKLLIKRDGRRHLIAAGDCKKRDLVATVGKIPSPSKSCPRWSDFVKENKLPFENCELDEDVYYLIGAFLGDGHSGAEIRKGVLVYKGPASIVNEDKEVLARVKKACRRYGIFFKITRNSLGIKQAVLTKAKWFREFLVRCGVGLGSDKHIDRLLLEGPQDRLTHLIRGLFDTDGCMEKGGRVSFSNTSKQLIKDLRRALLRNGIITWVRTRGGEPMRLHEKTYYSKPSQELFIQNSLCIRRFYEDIGFGVSRKQRLLKEIAREYEIKSIRCEGCDYIFHPNVFGGRTRAQKVWGKQKAAIIKQLGDKGEVGSRELKRSLGYEPKKNEARVNLHYAFIKKRKKGAHEWLWSLNSLGVWAYEEFIKKGGRIAEYFKENDECPICGGPVKKTYRGGWKSNSFEGDVYWDIINSKRTVKSSGHKVYDVVLRNDGLNDHLFVANGILVHNSAGLNMPARKVIIRDIKRYTGFGLDYIPVLEYLQMCLPYEEKIPTDKGILPIGKVVEERISCSVLSFNEHKEVFEFKPIREYYERAADEVMELTTDKGYKLRLTKEHPIRIGKEWKAAEEVKIGDGVGFNPYESSYSYVPNFFDLLPKGRLFVSGFGHLLERAKKETGKLDKELGEELGIGPKSIYHYKKDVKNMPLSCAIKLLDMLKLERKAHIKSVKTGYGSFLNIPDRIDEDLLWLAGIIATDGNIQRTVDKRTRSEYIKIRVFNNNKKIIEKSKRVMERLVSGKVYVSYKEGRGRCEMGATLLSKVLSEHFGIPFGNKTEKVRVPPFLLNAPMELVGAYLGGVFDGDGSYTVTKNKRFPTTDNQRILFVSSSKKFAVGIQELLLKLGIVAKLESKSRRLRVEIRGKSVEFKKPHYLVSFNRKDYIKTFARYAKPVKCKIEAQYKSYHNLDNYYRNREKHAKMRIVGKRDIAFSKGIKVYNIGVEGNENYIASGFLVHNCGRAGRPRYDKEGESVLLASNEYEKEFLEENYVNGLPENIHSQLGVEPVLRMHVLASVASGFTRDKKSLMDFFGATFFAHEYGTEGEFKQKVDRVLRQLEKWDFIKSKGGKKSDDLFVSASDIGGQKTEDTRLIPTPLGSRVSELYIDPETAHEFVEVFEDPDKIARIGTFSLLEFSCSTTEMRPLLRVRKKEEDDIWGLYYEREHKLLTGQSDSDYLNRFKTALMLNDWVEERTEDWILKNYGMAPGLLRIKLDTARWLAYSYSELIPYIKTDKATRRELQKLEMRLKHGIREELLPLASIKGIGRVRARKLFDAGIKSKPGIKKTPTKKLKELLGEKTAEKVLRGIA